jgi:transcriptional regulator with XRE-family HTH domain
MVLTANANWHIIVLIIPIGINNMFDTILDQIRLELEKEEISESELARQLGISQSTLNRILRNKRGLGIRVATKILQARPQWWGLVNGSEPAEDENGREPGHSPDELTPTTP